MKVVFREQYKTYRNLLSTLVKQSKQIYYTKYFKNNWNNIKNTWKGIKIIISIKNITTTVPHSIEFNNRTISDPTATSNIFNNYFTSTAKKINSDIKFSPKHYIDYYLIQTQIPFSWLKLTKMEYIFEYLILIYTKHLVQTTFL